MTHDLKCTQPYFQHVLDGDKTFELRDNDRGFQKGDTLRLRELNERGYYTDRTTEVLVTYVLSGHWLAPGFVALGIKELSKAWNEEQSNFEADLATTRAQLATALEKNEGLAASLPALLEERARLRGVLDRISKFDTRNGDGQQFVRYLAYTALEEK